MDGGGEVMMHWIIGAWCGIAFGFAAFYISPDERHEIKVSGAIAVYEGKATCEKALEQWVCKVRRN